MSENSERDLVLTPTSFAYVLDRTQGEVVLYVGPNKVSLADSDQPVVFDEKQKKFRYVSLNEAIQNMKIAPEGWYITMKNPAFAQDKSLKVGERGKNQTQQANLDIGRKVNIAGPISFPLWPGQMAQVIQGHHLRSNEFLLVRVYDEESAKENRDEAVVIQVGEGGVENKKQSLIPEDLTIGQQFIIKGTDASFFMPPTGIEVVKKEHVADHEDQFIRDAETLELQEYCILLDESGEKRFVRGPCVVFPKPTEEFVTKAEHRKFKAFELSMLSGLYIKATKDYVSEGPEHDGNTKGDEIKTGEELFITGETTPVYFPCEEHSIIQYGNNKKINHAVAIPAGTARYVLNRETGEISTRKGPDMFLPDPRKEVMIRRILSEKDVRLLFPNNQEALSVNAQLDEMRVGSTSYALSSVEVGASGSLDGGMRSLIGSDHASGPITRNKRRKAMKDFAGDQIVRGTDYNPPRTITLDTKYDGVVTTDVWTGFAVNVVSKSGTRRVETGPTTVMLNYDESLEPFYLSKGTPKTNKNRKEDVFLRVKNNRVTDMVKVQTKDLVPVNMVLSYRVNFEGDPDQWFNVDDYVGLLADHMRSLLRNEVQKHGIKDFWENKIDIVRDTVLGKSAESGRPGRTFEQNGMRIYDIDFVEAKIEDHEIERSLVGAQHELIKQALDLEHNSREFEVFKESQVISRNKMKEEDATANQRFEIDLAQIQRSSASNMETIELARLAEETKLNNKLNEQDLYNKIQAEELTRIDSDEELKNKIAQASLRLRTDELDAQTKAKIDEIKAVSPQLVAVLESIRDSELLTKLAHEVGPRTILGGDSVAEIVTKMLGGMGLDHVIDKLPSISKSNGTINNNVS